MKPDGCSVLLSIRKPYSRQILDGKKKFELRKRKPKNNCNHILIYETSPTMAIIGFAKVSKIHTESIDKIWKLTKGRSCVSKDFFDKYYENKSHGVAIEIKKVRKLDKPVPLSYLGIERAPQDFMYVRNLKPANLVTV